MQSNSIILKQELNISFILAFVYSLRMLGIFLVLPVFFLYAINLNNGNKLLAGIAFGIYGLTQAVFQIPFGMLSDKFGRKKIIFIGLSIFAIGSFLSAIANNVYFLILARAIQGSGAVSAVVTALLADLTRKEVRVRAMSIIGSSIALTFSISLVISPLLSKFINVSGIFVLTGFLIILSILIIYYKIPNTLNPSSINNKFSSIKLLFKAIQNKRLWHLNFGIFVLHCVQMSFFTALPFFLSTNLNFSKYDHWKLYLPAIILGIILMIPVIIYAEKKFKLKQFILFGILLIIINQLILSLYNINNIWLIFLSLIFYFTGLNILEAILPSWVSKESSDYYKGTSMGIYNTFMSLGIFSGGFIGGLLQKYFNLKYVFYYSIIFMLIWFFVVCLNKNYCE